MNFKPIRPTGTGGGGRAAGDKLKYKDGSTNWIRCYICGLTVDSKVRDVCPLCGSDNFRGTVRGKR